MAVVRPTAVAVSNDAGSTGIVSYVSTGTATISASMQGLSGQVDAVVTPAKIAALFVTAPSSGGVGATYVQQFTANAVYTNGQIQNVTQQASWTSSDPSVAAMLPQPGLLQAYLAGAVNVTATLDGISGTDDYTITDAVLNLQSLTVVPASAQPGSDLPFTVLGTFSDGSQQDVTAYVLWELVNGVTLVNFPQTLLQSSAPTISSIFMDENTRLPPGAQLPVMILIRYSDGSVSLGNDPSITWTSSDPSVAQAVTCAPPCETGVVLMGYKQGTATVTATAPNGVSGSQQVEVQTVPPPPNPAGTFLAITADNLMLSRGQTTTLHATALDSSGGSRDVTQQTTWTVNNTAVVQIDGNTVTAKTQGDVVITGSYSDPASTSGTLSAAIIMSVINLSGPY